MNTQFPAKIDDSITLSTSSDNASLVRSKVTNDLRDAIIAIESALGINPASVYGTVRERFSAIDAALADIITSTDALILSGDLSGSNISQKVIGLQGNSISNASPTDGYTWIWENSLLEWVPMQISNSGVSSSAAIAYSKLNLAGNIVNADVKSSAAIDYSKLGTGTQSLGAQQFNSTVDSKGTVKDVQPKNVQTVDATVTTLDSFTIASNTTLIISAAITAVKSDNTQGAGYLRTAAFRNNAGTVAQISTTQDGGTFEDDASWDATIDNSTTTIRIRVTGKAATTIRWSCISTRIEVQA